ncbi:MAG: hypothetical protein EZS28_018327 [Streblomastix strix]|uniref:Uncharacterized protein n=1 Tax=Streblomastix strix TaxID=222440 RepID=A0A5J4VU50_9EUKA|nr:MAG: hypothetical protein EZS28_018327 [Streblomastix strix]
MHQDNQRFDFNANNSVFEQIEQNVKDMGITVRSGIHNAHEEKIQMQEKFYDLQRQMRERIAELTLENDRVNRLLEQRNNECSTLDRRLAETENSLKRSEQDKTNSQFSNLDLERTTKDLEKALVAERQQHMIDVEKERILKEDSEHKWEAECSVRDRDIQNLKQKIIEVEKLGRQKVEEKEKEMIRQLKVRDEEKDRQLALLQSEHDHILRMKENDYNQQREALEDRWNRNQRQIKDESDRKIAALEKELKELKQRADQREYELIQEHLGLQETVDNELEKTRNIVVQHQNDKLSSTTGKGGISTNANVNSGINSHNVSQLPSPSRYTSTFISQTPQQLSSNSQSVPQRQQLDYISSPARLHLYSSYSSPGASSPSAIHTSSTSLVHKQIKG